jgi:hypothetical protein
VRVQPRLERASRASARSFSALVSLARSSLTVASAGRVTSYTVAPPKPSVTKPQMLRLAEQASQRRRRHEADRDHHERRQDTPPPRPEQRRGEREPRPPHALPVDGG